MRALLIAVLSLFCTGCSVLIQMPVNRFDSPEVVGQPGVIKGDLGLQGVSQVTLTEDPASDVPPNVTTPLIEGVNRVRVTGTYSALEILDIEYRPPTGVSLKVQLLGDSYKSAKRGNFSLAASAGLKYAMNRDPDPVSKDQNQMRMSETMFDAALITGYRVADVVLLYGGIFTENDSFNGDWHDHSVDFESSARLNGFNTGVELSATNFQFRLEYALSKTITADTDKSIGSFGFNASYLF
jgi:hypothetical protein